MLNPKKNKPFDLDRSLNRPFYIIPVAVAGIVISIYVVMGVGNHFDFVDSKGDVIDSSYANPYQIEEVEKSISKELLRDYSESVVIPESKTVLTTLSEVREVFVEIVTKQDLIGIVNEKDWVQEDKDLWLEFIGALPEDQDLFILKENLLEMTMIGYSPEKWESVKKNPNDKGYFHVKDKLLEYLNDPKASYYFKRFFFHEALHATTLLITEKDGYTIKVVHSLYDAYLMEIATVLWENVLSTENTFEENSIWGLVGYENIINHFKGYIYYYGGEVIVDYLRHGNIEGFIDFAAKDFPDVREHVALVSVCYNPDLQATEDNFYRLLSLTHAAFLQSQMSGHETGMSHLDGMGFASPIDWFYADMCDVAQKKGIELDLQRCALMYDNLRKEMLIDKEKTIN